mmetsp:Transcript_2045/g.3061  ORF Transcript_2045/g.3061 Transcript_2045/m.3061 type:complete len:106 (-) Transcript_2045:7-324(-)
MRCGDRFVIYTDKMKADFKKDYNFPPDHWPSDEIFDFKHWREDDTYMKVVKEEENHDMLKNKGKYYMEDNFQMIVLASWQNPEDAKLLMDGIPHVEDMAKYIIVD